MEENEAQNKITRLQEKRKQAFKEIERLYSRLLKARNSEYHDIVFDNECIRPKDAAKFVSERFDQLELIPGPTKDHTICLPVSQVELETVYQSNSQITLDEEHQLHINTIKLAKVWEPKKN